MTSNSAWSGATVVKEGWSPYVISAYSKETPEGTRAVVEVVTNSVTIARRLKECECLYMRCEVGVEGLWCFRRWFPATQPMLSKVVADYMESLRSFIAKS